MNIHKQHKPRCTSTKKARAHNVSSKQRRREATWVRVCAVFKTLTAATRMSRCAENDAMLDPDHALEPFVCNSSNPYTQTFDNETTKTRLRYKSYILNNAKQTKQCGILEDNDNHDTSNKNCTLCTKQKFTKPIYRSYLPT